MVRRQTIRSVCQIALITGPGFGWNRVRLFGLPTGPTLLKEANTCPLVRRPLRLIRGLLLSTQGAPKPHGVPLPEQQVPLRMLHIVSCPAIMPSTLVLSGSLGFSHHACRPGTLWFTSGALLLVVGRLVACGLAVCFALRPL